MGRSFEVKKADELLLDVDFTAKWRDRQALELLPRMVLRAILNYFVSTGGPVKVETVRTLLPEHDPAEVYLAVEELNKKDMILIQDGQVVLAYPFAGAPTTFTVVLPDGRERYAVCAIDALGIPAMLGQPVTIRSRCHHCQEPLELHVRPGGPVGPSEVMVWVGDRGELRDKAFSSL